MTYTKDNPKLVDYFYYFEGKETFTGVVKDRNDTIYYYLNGKWHREDGPAILHCNGDTFWFLNGIRHRINGPAVEYGSDTKKWFLNGKFHREDGPAVEHADGDKQWYLNDKCYGHNDDFTNESWIRFVKLELLK